MLQACDKAVADLIGALDQKNVVIGDLERQVALAKQVAADAEAESGRFYRNPFVMGSLGLVVGVLAGVWVRK